MPAAKLKVSETRSPSSHPMLRTLTRLLMADGPGARVPSPVAAWVMDLMELGKPTGVRLDHRTEGDTHWLVVTGKDQPFLTDTVLLALKRHGLEPLAVWHPVLTVTRAGKMVTDMRAASARGRLGAGQTLESVILVMLDAEPDAKVLADVKAGQLAAQAAVKDYTDMQALLETAAAHTEGEDKAFVKWLLDGHLIVLGCRHYDYRSAGSGLTVQVTPGSGLGILSDDTLSQALAPMPLDKAGLAHLADETGRVLISKTPDRSIVHRDAAMDVVSLLERDAKGRLCGEQRFVGLWASRAYTRHVGDIPLIRRKIEQVMRSSSYPAGSLKARMLVNVLETWPRDELFLTSVAELGALAEAVVSLKERPDVRLLLRHSLRERAITALLYVPLARYTSTLRERVVARLCAAYGGEVQDFRLELGDADMARLMVRLHVPGAFPAVDEAALETELRHQLRGWEDDVKAMDAHLWRWYGQHARASYREVTEAARAVADFRALENGQKIEIVPEGTGETVALRLFSRGVGHPLFRLVPLMDTTGLAVSSEQEFVFGTDATSPRVQVLKATPLQAVTAPLARELERLLSAGLRPDLVGDCADELNRLVLLGGLTMAEISWLRLLAAYAQQVDRGFDPVRTRALLLEYVDFAVALVKLFAARLDPALKEAARARLVKPLQQKLEALASAMSTSPQEKLANTLVDTVNAILRTNAWRGDMVWAGGDLPLAIKLDPARITALPKPRPWREMFVHHPAVEGVHLRGGSAARGGLRHSDRATDFRTEVLGLMAAQMRKNTIIVPVGAKGGFYIKETLPGDRAAAGVRIELNYRRYIRALLSITDTYAADGRVAAPRHVLRHDGDDPYFVVAADKGTARFSDTANDEALHADFWDGVSGGFWLGDAFASGGSQGYDHKEMGITSRGAWVSVTHHLRALGITPAPNRPLVMAGIGDMAGDVFGNGLLREPHVQLVAAFNHVHIFLDPDPDMQASFAERKRCFEAGLGWDGYDKTLISNGGGVFLRSAKAIPLHARVQARLGLKKAQATPEEIMAAILRAPVDVLWNGGIGTFIKASDETHAIVADRANDAIRVDAQEVRAKVIGEGGNLGITPRGRVALALRGVRLNTDALDNSAGVDTSDHEVNVKILLQQAMAQKTSKLDMPARNKLLRRMTEEVAEAVLTDNRLQNMAVTLEERGSTEDHVALLAWQNDLLRRGVVDITVDMLPTPEQLEQRSPYRYVRPEICALLAGTKMTIRAQLLAPEASDILISSAAQPLLAAYFPPALRTTYADLLSQHRLARDIVATAMANELVNRLGLLFVPRLAGDFGASPLECLRAAVVACAMMDARRFWHELDSASTNLTLDVEVAAHQRLRQVAYGLAAWVLRHGQPVDMLRWLEDVVPPVLGTFARLPDLLSATARGESENYAREWLRQGIPSVLAQRMSLLSPLVVVPDAVVLANGLNQPMDKVLMVHLGVGEILRMPSVIRRVRGISAPDAWTRQAVQAMVQEFFNRQRRLSAMLLQDKGSAPALLDGWQRQAADTLRRYHSLVNDLLKEPKLSVAMLSVLIGRLRELD